MSGLDDESRKALVEYRLERAYATMQEAAVMTEKEFYNAAVNRLYYDKEMTDDLTTQAKTFIDYIGNLVKEDSVELNN